MKRTHFILVLVLHLCVDKNLFRFVVRNFVFTKFTFISLFSVYWVICSFTAVLLLFTFVSWNKFYWILIIDASLFLNINILPVINIDLWFRILLPVQHITYSMTVVGKNYFVTFRFSWRIHCTIQIEDVS